ncbi:MAG: hypothetical protein PVJ33_04085 [Lysobacterales bacterium]|jgi:hypothetical protein
MKRKVGLGSVECKQARGSHDPASAPVLGGRSFMGLATEILRAALTGAAIAGVVYRWFEE